MGSCNFFPENSIRFPQDLQLFFCNLPQNAHGKTRTRERLTPNQFMRNAQLFSNLTNLVLEKITKRLNYFFKRDHIRKPAHIVMTLDNCRITLSAFDHVRVNRSLRQHLNFAELFGLIFKYPNKFFSDDFSLLFRFYYSRQPGKKSILRIDAYK